MALAALLVSAGGSAGAAELLVMPYTCTMAGGQPVLIPGPERGHRILGERQRRSFSACSPVNPDMCRTWTVHRFDLDCDGERTPWVSVMAATGEGSRRAWLLGGRLLLRMGPRWSLAPDDPCARDPDERFAFDRGMRHECADRLATAPPAVVEMPFGYAPMLGIDAIFVEARPRGPDKAPPPTLPPIAAGPAPPEPATARRQAAPAGPAPEPTAPARQTATAPKAETTPPREPPRVASTAKPSPAVAAPTRSRTPRDQEPPQPAASDAKPKPETATAPKAPAQVATAQTPPAPRAATPAMPPRPEARRAPRADPAAAATAEAPEAPAPPPPPKRAERRAAPSAPGEQPEPAFGLNLLNVFRATTTGAIVAFAGLALGLLTAFAVARRREHARDTAGRQRRDISAPSLDGKRARPSARTGGGRRRPMPQTAPAATGSDAAQSTAAGRLADWGDRMPRTREEALEVLGIGIAPSATEVAIKKIVDGLRMSWHPDHARDETDRALRELRSKQINAAWDLLQTQRAQRQRAEV